MSEEAQGKTIYDFVRDAHEILEDAEYLEEILGGQRRRSRYAMRQIYSAMNAAKALLDSVKKNDQDGY